MGFTEWDYVYNFHRPHGAFNEIIPYEVLNLLLKKSSEMFDRI